MMDKHNKVKKTDIKWYYNLNTRKDIFENGMKSKVVAFSYSPIELYFLLKEINEHEPALIDMIISFMCIKKSIYYWSKFYYNISLSKEDVLLIKYIYPVKYDTIDLCISNVDYYLNNKKYSSLFQTIIRDINAGILYTKPKYNYYKYPQDLIRTIGLYYIMNYKQYIVDKRNLYETVYNKTKDHFIKDQKSPLSHLGISKTNIELCQKIYKQYIKDICKEMKHCYKLGY
jgi:hypothetical protein